PFLTPGFIAITLWVIFGFIFGGIMLKIRGGGGPLRPRLPLPSLSPLVTLISPHLACYSASFR
ncbi:hypothetical protein FAS40_27335, partial [Klebsiella pneumoniae]